MLEILVVALRPALPTSVQHSPVSYLIQWMSDLCLWVLDSATKNKAQVNLCSAVALDAAEAPLLVLQRILSFDE
jgi:hypothetical protein